MSWNSLPARTSARRASSLNRRQHRRLRQIEQLEARQLLATWQGPDGGNWNNAANWVGDVPDVAGETADFGAFTGTVVLDIANVTIDSLNFGASSNVTINPFAAGNTIATPLVTTNATAGANVIAARLDSNSFTGTLSGGSLALTNTLTGAQANNLSGTITVSTGATLIAPATTDSNPLGIATIRLSGGILETQPQLTDTSTGYDAKYINAIPDAAGGRRTTEIDFDAATAAQTLIGPSTLNIDVGNNVVPPGTSGVDSDWSALFTGLVDIPQGGIYTFTANSDDGSRLYIDGNLIAINDSTHGKQERQGTVALGAGLHTIRMEMFDSGSGGAAIVSYEGPGVAKTLVPWLNQGLSISEVAEIVLPNAVELTLDSQISYGAGSVGNVRFASLTLEGGTTLNLPTAGRTVLFDETNFATGSSSDYGVSGAGDLTTGRLDDEASTNVRFSRSGTGALIVNNTSVAATLASGDVIAADGTGSIAIQGQGSINPLGGAMVELNVTNALLQLSSKGGDVTFDNAVLVNENAEIRVSGPATGTPDNNQPLLEVTLGSASNGITVADGKTLTLNSHFNLVNSNVVGGTRFVIDGNIAGNNITIDKIGNGILELDDVSKTYSGTTLLTTGTLRLDTANAIPNSSDIVITSGRTLELSSADALPAAVGVTISNGATLALTNANVLTTGHNFTFNSGARINVTNGAAIDEPLTVGAGVIFEISTTSAGGLNGTGTITRHIDSIVRVSNATGLNGTQLPASAILAGERVQVNTNNIQNLGSTQPGAIIEIFNGDRQLSGTVFNGQILTNDGSSRRIQDTGGVISSTALGFIVAATSGTNLEISEEINAPLGTVTFGSTTQINGRNKAGTVIHDGTTNNTGGTGATNPWVIGDMVIVAGAYTQEGGGPATLDVGSITVNAGATYNKLTGVTTIIDDFLEVNGTVNARLGNTTVPELRGSGNISLGNTNEAVTWIIGGGNTDSTFSGSISQLSATGSVGSIQKVGTGKLTFAGNNTYSGATTIDDGTLAFSADSPTYVVSNSTYTVNNGATLELTGSGNGVFRRDMTGIGNLVKSGTGSWTIDVSTSTNTLVGDTSVLAGELVAPVSEALGTTTVIIADTATLTLGSATSLAGFGVNGAGFTTNGVTVTSDVARLTTRGTGNDANSIWTQQKVSVETFEVSFDYNNENTQVPNGADGFTFGFQNASANALGGAGGSRGYSGIGTSFVLAIDNHDGGASPVVGYSFGQNGTISANVASTPIIIGNGVPINFHLTYDGTMLTVTLQQGANNLVINQAVNIASIVGGSTAWMGFTAGTGGESSTQEISNFEYTTSIFDDPIVIADGANATINVVASDFNSVHQVSSVTLGAGSTLNVGAHASSSANGSYALSVVNDTAINGAATVNVTDNGAGDGELTLNTISGSASAALTKQGAGLVTLNGDSSSSYLGELTVGSGILALNAASTNNVAGAIALLTAAGATLDVTGLTGGTLVLPSGQTLGGNGTVLGNVTGAGTVSPGFSAGTLAITGNFTPTGTVEFEVASPFATPGVDFDQLVVTGATNTVNLSGATLSFPGAPPAAPPGTTIRILDNQTSNPTTPPASLPEGSVVVIGSAVFVISYIGGDGNDVELSTGPAPTVVYVDDSFGAPGTVIADADPVAGGNQPAIVGLNAFTSVNQAISVVTVGGTVVVNAGDYNEAVLIDKQLTMTLQEGPISFDNLDDSVANATINLNTALTVGDGNGFGEITSPIQGPGSLTKVGATGVLAFDGTASNTYTGTTTILGGQLILNKSGGATAIAGDITIGDASGSDILRLEASEQIADTSVITFTAGGDSNSAFFQLNGQTETVAGIQTTVANAAVIENGSSGNGLLIVNNSANFTYDGILRDLTGTLSLTKTGTGTLTLANTVEVVATNYTGPTIVNGGTLVLSDLDTFVSPIQTNSEVEFAQLTKGLNYTQVISGSGDVTKSGPQLLQLGGGSPNTYSGDTFLESGFLRFDKAGALGTSLVNITAGANLLLWYGSAGSTQTVTNNFVLNGIGATPTAGGVKPTIYGDGGGSFAGTYVLSGNILLNATSNVGGNNANNLEITGVISGPGGLTKGGSRGDENSLLTLSGANTYQGDTVLNKGGIRLGASEVIPHGATAGNLVISSGLVVNLNGFNETVNAISGAGVVDNLAAGPATLTIGADGSNTTLGSQIQDTGGNVNLVKVGAGILTLTGTNSYAGTTTVSGGTLLANATNATGSGDVTVDAAGTLGGNGSIAGNVVVNGTLAPGALDSPGSIATLAIGGLLTLNGTYEADIVSDVNRDLVTANSIALNSATLVLNITGVISPATEIVVLDSDTTLTGSFVTGTPNLTYPGDRVVDVGGDFYHLTVGDPNSRYANIDSSEVALVRNSPVVAEDNTYSTLTNTAISGNVLTDVDAVAGVDDDPDGDAVIDLLSTPPLSEGMLVFDEATGAFTFTPANNFNGEVTFDYSLSDGEVTSVATVTIIVSPIYVDANDNLQVAGSTGSDRITVYNGGPFGIAVRVNNVVYNQFSFGGKVIVFGFAGADTIMNSANLAVEFYGGEGNDYLSGGLLDDILDGGAGSDRLFGNAGNDYLYGGAGIDAMSGGLGDDFLFGDAYLDSEGFEQLPIASQQGADTMNGDQGDDTMYGHGGNDRMSGGAGDDFMRGGEGIDTMSGDDGDDTISGDNGSDKLYGRNGNDVIFGGGAGDTIYGGNGEDLLYGNLLGVDTDARLAEIALFWFNGQQEDAYNRLRNDSSPSTDNVADILYGEGGYDWYLLFSKDRVAASAEARPGASEIRNL